MAPAEAPAHRKIQIAGVIGDLMQVHGAVVKDITECGPEQLGLRMRRLD